MDTEEYMQALLNADPFRESIIREMIHFVNLPIGSSGLDVGCGVGLQCLLLAQAIGPAGHVTGLDVILEFLERGQEIVSKARFSNQISFQQGDVARLPFDDNAFDWVWSSDCVGYVPWEPVPLLEELARVVKPGGIVAFAAWSSEKLLPGYPDLEARLGTTLVGLAPFVPGREPEKHFLRALGWFRELGFVEPMAEVFSKSVCSPQNDAMRNSLAYLLESRWQEVEAELNPNDREMFQRLCKPDSPDFILDHPDYYGFFTYSLFWGKVPG